MLNARDNLKGSMRIVAELKLKCVHIEYAQLLQTFLLWARLAHVIAWLLRLEI